MKLPSLSSVHIILAIFIFLGFVAMFYHLSNFEDTDNDIGTDFVGWTQHPDQFGEVLREPMVYIRDKQNRKVNWNCNTGTKNTMRKESKGEARCREIFEYLFGVEFKSIRPDWLYHEVTGNNLELDGYNEELGLGFEYDGAQHSKYNPWFHQSKRAFLYQCEKDDLKNQLCQQKGVKLVRIPSHVKYHDLKEYIIKELTKLGLWPRIPKVNIPNEGVVFPH